MLNSLAWGIAIATENRDLDLALKAASRAVELTENKDAMILDTLARVHYEQGDLDTAIQWQRQAVEHGSGRAEITAALDKYLSEQGSLVHSQEGTDGDAT